MNKKKFYGGILLAGIALLAIAAHYLFDPWGFYRKVSLQEQKLRLSLVQSAEAYLGYNESDGSYLGIIEAYNTLPSLPQNYVLSPQDSWCAAFVTVAAMDAGLTDCIPPECGCERQIQLLQQMGCWEENDGAIPLPGDLIYYDWEGKPLRDCTGWADHVGIVIGVKWPFIKVIEGNWDDRVCCRRILIGDRSIRGYGMPSYAASPAE